MQLQWTLPTMHAADDGVSCSCAEPQEPVRGIEDWLRVGCVLAGLAIGCAGTPSAAAVPRLSECSISITYVNMDRAAGETQRLIMAAWSDGTLVWSEDEQEGGPPFMLATVAADAVALAITEVADKCELLGEDVRNAGVHFPFQVIHVRTANRSYDLESWHELAERTPNVIATDEGLGWYTAQSRIAVLRATPLTYRLFRTVWDFVRLRTRALVPERGIPVTPPIEWDADVMR